jgi:hypothetical protein
VEYCDGALHCGCIFNTLVIFFLQELHHQVLCPAIGWTPNFHAYTVRRIVAREHVNPNDETEEERSKRTRSILKSREDECWTGPNRSTALNVFFQPLYIGGALANEDTILIGDLYYGRDDDSPCLLQYVQDFGCWWSHTIQVEPSSEEPPSGGSVAILTSGRGACPPDDSGGILRYCKSVKELVNPSDASDASDPSKTSWWAIVNKEWRAKQNKQGMSNPFTFDMEAHRRAMKGALSQPLAKRSTEYLRAANFDRDSNRFGSAIGTGGSHQELKTIVTDPTELCAVCGVTAGLMLCSGCRSIGFCCRDHQLEYWPKYKTACKATQAKAKPTPSNKTSTKKRGKK